MTTFEEMLKKRPIDPQVLEAKVQKMHEETRAYQEAHARKEAAAELNVEAHTNKASRSPSEE